MQQIMAFPPRFAITILPANRIATSIHPASTTPPHATQSPSPSALGEGFGVRATLGDGDHGSAGEQR